MWCASWDAPTSRSRRCWPPGPQLRSGGGDGHASQKNRADPLYHGYMRAVAKRLAILCAGWGFILLGIAGLFLPVLQGILFLLIGLIILSTEYAWAHHLLQRLKERFPAIARKAEEASARAHRWV